MKEVYLLSTIVLLGILLHSCLGTTTTWNLHSEIDVCTLFPNGAVLRKPGTCAETIICENGVSSTEGAVTCTGTQGYKLDTKKCAAVSDDYCSTPCVKGSPMWVSGKRNCHDWSACDGKTELNTGTCPNGQIFNQADQRCEYKPSGFVCNKVYDICNISPKDQPFWDEVSCHKYFYCDKNQKQQTAECDIGLYYDKVSGTCVKKAQVDCYKHPIPANVCGTEKLAIRGRFVKDQATCNGYFYCQDLGSGKPDQNPSWGQCGNNYFFDETIQACRDRNLVECADDRCVGRSSGLELAAEAGCQHYLICENGYTMGEEKCQDDYYFDPTTEQCVEQKISYPICEAN